MSTGPTIFEVVRRVDDLAARLERREEASADRFDLIANKIDAAVLRIEERSVSKEAHAALVERVRKIEDRSEWLVRIVGALVIGAVLALVFATGSGPST